MASIKTLFSFTGLFSQNKSDAPEGLIKRAPTHKKRMSMTEEEKQAAEIAAAEAKKAEEEKANADFEATLEGLSDEEKVQKRADKKAQAEIEHLQKIHETELQREKERAQKIIAEKDFELRERKRREREKEQKFDDEGNPIIEEEEKPLTASQLEEILAKDREQNRKELQSGIIAEKAGKLARSATEKDLIIEIHKNRTFPSTLSLDEQLEECFAIANRKSLLAENEELKRSLKHKDTVSKDVASGHQETLPTGEPKATSADIQALKGAGFVWDGKTNAWKKETKERIIFKSKDMKKTWTESRR